MNRRLPAFKMRTNGKELTAYVNNVGEVDKEGVLLVREKSDRIFKKGDVYTERFFQLKNNMLFYRKNKAKSSDVSGVYVLEGCIVQLDEEDDSSFGFLISFESDDKPIRLLACSEADRDAWIQKLHICAYECLQMQAMCLREQIKSRTGQDPVPENNPVFSYHPGLHVADEEPVFEFSIACSKLPVTGCKNISATIHILTKNKPQWTLHTETEVVEGVAEPCFLTTVCLLRKEIFGQETQVQLTLHEVMDTVNELRNTIGCGRFPLQQLLDAEQFMLKVTLTHPTTGQVGEVQIMGWLNIELPECTIETPPSSPVSEKLVRLNRQTSSMKQMESLKPQFANLVAVSFAFPTVQGHVISVHEFMGESRLTFHVPRQLLMLWIDEENKNLAALESMGQLATPLDQWVQDYRSSIGRLLSQYKLSGDYLNAHTDIFFKKSRDKGVDELEFVPTNLHLQRMRVQDSVTKQITFYDATTSGAFTAFRRKFKRGGLHRLLAAYWDSLSTDTRQSLNLIGQLMCAIERLAKDVDIAYGHLCTAAIDGDRSNVIDALGKLKHKTQQLTMNCEHDEIEFSQAAMASVSKVGKVPSTSNHSDNSSPEKSWKLTAADLDHTQEPFACTRCKVLDMLVSLESAALQALDTAAVSMWLPSISPAAVRFRGSVQHMCNRVRTYLTFRSIQLSSSTNSVFQDIKYRRNVVFSQMLTSTLSAIINHLHTHLPRPGYCHQLVHSGLLLQVESLLSCHGDELSMLEDMWVGLGDLQQVTFRLQKEEEGQGMWPRVEGNSSLPEVFPYQFSNSYMVNIPLPDHLFGVLPEPLQQGHMFKVTTVMFTIGINEQATLAERIGDLSFQDFINQESLKTLVEYYRLCKANQLIRDQGVRSSYDQLQSQLNKLHHNIQSGKKKNVEILHIASQVTRELDGVRMTCCKSGKDRTSMAVTLEQVELLIRHHGLPTYEIIKTLDCLRRQGVRRENARKNVGQPQFAFNSLQLMSFPKLYRPPPGTYGATEA